MVKVAKTMQNNSLTIPLLIGGAMTSKLHTATKINPEYPSGLVVHVADASKAVEAVSKLSSNNSQQYIIDGIQHAYQN